MSATTAIKEGRVNVPLGIQKPRLGKHAAKSGTTETNLARLILLDGLDRLDSGDFVVTGPSIVPACRRKTRKGKGAAI